MIYRRKPIGFIPSFEVVSCFLEFDNEIVLLKRKLTKLQGGKWGVPAGKINNDEDRVSAMIREIKEETGITVLSSKLHFFKSLFVHHTVDFVYHMFYLFPFTKIPSCAKF